MATTTTALSTGVNPSVSSSVSPYTQSGSVSSWAQPYVSDMLSTASSLADKPYTPYSGDLVAGQSNLQTEAFSGIGSLTAPTGAYTPTQFNADYTPEADYQTGTFNANYTPQSAYTGTSFDSGYTAPAAYQAGTFANQYNAPTLSDATKFTNQYVGPSAYQGTDFDTGTWSSQQAQQYMNPYLQAALQPQVEEARRQSQLTQMQNAAKATQAGAYGGSRQALMDAETQRALGTNLANIVGTGYKNAYDTALSQFNTDQARQLQAQQASEASKQYGYTQGMTAAQLQAQYGLSAQQATEAARQFNTQQQMTAAQLQAQYGLSAQQAAEASRQYGYTQSADAAKAAAQYNLQEQQAQEASKQYGYTQAADAAKTAAQYNLQAQQAAEASRQYGYGQAMTADQLAAQYGLQEQQAQEAANQFGANYGLSSLKAAQDLAQTQASMGATQRDITQQGLTSAYQQWQNKQQYPYQQLQFQQSMLSGLPITTNQVTTPPPSTLQTVKSALGELASGSTTAFNLLKQMGVVNSNSLADALKQGYKWLTGADSGISQITNTAGAGEAGYGWQYYSDGTAISPEGVYYMNGEAIYDPSMYATTDQYYT